MNDVAAEKSDLWRENPHRVGKETDDVKNNTTYAFQNLNENSYENTPIVYKGCLVVHISIPRSEIAKST